MFTTSLPIKISATSLTKYNEYSNYELSLGHYVNDLNPISYTLLYTGKTYWNGASTEVELSRLLRNFQLDFKPEWKNNEQRFIPQGYDVNLMSGMSPVENGNACFGNGTFKLEFEDEMPIYFDTSMLAHPFYTGDGILPLDLFNINDTEPVIQVYNRMFHCNNHIPYVNQKNNLIGWFFGINTYLFNMLDTASVRLVTSSNRFDLTLNGVGTYSAAVNANKVFTALSITGETDIFLISTTVPIGPGHKYADEYHLVHIDECPRDFYVHWWDSCGWHCLGFDGNVVIQNTSDNKSITTPLGVDAVYAANGKTTFNLNSGYVEEDVVRTIMTLRDAKNIFVHDTRYDRGQWCTLKNLSRAELNTKRYNPQNISVQLEEAIMLKS